MEIIIPPQQILAISKGGLTFKGSINSSDVYTLIVTHCERNWWVLLVLQANSVAKQTINLPVSVPASG